MVGGAEAFCHRRAPALIGASICSGASGGSLVGAGWEVESISPSLLVSGPRVSRLSPLNESSDSRGWEMRIISAATLTAPPTPTPPFTSSGAAKRKDEGSSSALDAILNPADRGALVIRVTETLLFHICTRVHLTSLSAWFQLRADQHRNTAFLLSCDWLRVGSTSLLVSAVFFFFPPPFLRVLLGDGPRDVAYYIYLASVAMAGGATMCWRETSRQLEGSGL